MCIVLYCACQEKELSIIPAAGEAENNTYNITPVDDWLGPTLSYLCLCNWRVWAS